MPKRLKLIKGFLNNQSIDGVVGLNIAYSNSNYAAENFPSAYASVGPQGIAFDKFGNLWMADRYRKAIIMYPPANQYNGNPATFVIGAPNLNTNQAASLTQSGFGEPTFIAFDNNNNLWVYDYSYHRILGFKYPFGSGGVLNASWVIGQPNFTSNLTGITSSLFSITTYLDLFCFDNENNLWVADGGNNRVLGFAANNIYTTGNAQASWVIGQPNFTSHTVQTLSAKSLSVPSGITIDKNGNLWVIDSNNTRVLGYTNPKSIMPAANYVIGAPNFTTTDFGATQNTFTGGIESFSSIAFDNNNNLWVYDGYRILGFSSSSLYGNNQPDASWLMFQPNYTTADVSTLSQEYTQNYDNAGFFYTIPVPNDNIVAALPNPYQIAYSYQIYLAFDSNNNIWISDTENSRILQYLDPTQNTYPYNCNTILAQSGLYIKGSTAQTQFEFVEVCDVAFDINNNLWVADGNKVAGFQYPNYNQQVMQNWVVGAPNFTTSGSHTQNGVTSPGAIAFDNFGNLFIADNYEGNRILGFSVNSLYGNNQPNAFVVIGQSSYTTTIAATTQNGLNITPATASLTYGKMAFDSSNNMYVCDTGNNRIMVFPYGTGFTVGMNASIVIGQASFTTNTLGDTASTFNVPSYCIIDKSGNLWVSDTYNNRVQKFIPPFTTGMSASVSITGFTHPIGLAFDIAGNLLVADNLNNRILLFTPSSITASTTVSSASIALGQPNLTSTARGIGTNGLFGPRGLAINPVSGDLWCIDQSNNRCISWLYTHKATLSNKYNSKWIFYNE